MVPVDTGINDADDDALTPFLLETGTACPEFLCSNPLWARKGVEAADGVRADRFNQRRIRQYFRLGRIEVQRHSVAGDAVPMNQRHLAAQQQRSFGRELLVPVCDVFQVELCSL